MLLTLTFFTDKQLLAPIGIAVLAACCLLFCFAVIRRRRRIHGRKNIAATPEQHTAFVKMAEIILEGCGGKRNIVSINYCLTRLKLEVKDRLLVDDQVIKSSGAAGVIRPGKTSVHVIIGPKILFVAEEFRKLCK